MNTKLLEERIARVKDQLPEIYNDVLPIVVPFYLLHQKLFNATTNIQHENYQISSSELDVMRCIKMSHNKDNILSPTQIYEKLMFTSGAITKVLKKLEEKGYIIRLENSFDKRSKLVQLTALGDEVCSKALIEIFAYEKECFSVLSKEEQESFKALLLKVLREL